MLKPLTNQGFTNKVFYDDETNRFIKIKSYDGFNHKSDAFLLNNLDFCPKIFVDNKKELQTEWINGITLNESLLTDDILKTIGKNLITLHNSKLKFYKENQIARRFNIYRKKISSLNRRIPILDKYYKKINLFLRNIDNSAPVHNDLWLFNMIKVNDKIYFTDWEYATMGDVHFDLAYFIESSNLNEKQEKVFLDAYGDDFEPKYLFIHKILVNALIVLWINAHEIPPFDDSLYLNRVEKYMKQLEKEKE